MGDVLSALWQAVFTGAGQFWKALWALSVVEMATFAIDYTFWLNLVAVAVAVVLTVLARRGPDDPDDTRDRSERSTARAGTG